MSTHAEANAHSMKPVIDLIHLISGQLEEAAQSDVVVGQPIELGAITLVPLSRLSVGLGLGGGEGDGEVHSGGRRRRRSKGRGLGAGAGMGAKVRPVAVAIFSESGVEVLPIADRKGTLDRIFDKIPEIIDLLDRDRGGEAGEP